MRAQRTGSGKMELRTVRRAHGAQEEAGSGMPKETLETELRHFHGALRAETRDRKCFSLLSPAKVPASY